MSEEYTRGGSFEDLDLEYYTEKGWWVPYRYNPSVPAAAIFAGFFGIAAVLHSYRIFKYKGWYFIPFVIGTLFECIGFAARIGNHYDFWSLTWFIMQSLLILLAPALFAASIYMTLSRIAIALHSEHMLAIRPKWLTTFFVTGDVLSFLTQSAGGGIMSSGSAGSYEKGYKIIVGGLFIQIAFFSGFLIISTMWYLRLTRSASHTQEAFKGRYYIWVMYGASALILIRSIFRVVEYLMPEDGPLLSNEYYLYIFDAALMAIVVGLYIAIKPYGELFDEWKRRKEAGDLEMTRRTNITEPFRETTTVSDSEFSSSSSQENRKPRQMV